MRFFALELCIYRLIIGVSLCRSTDFSLAHSFSFIVNQLARILCLFSPPRSTASKPTFAVYSSSHPSQAHVHARNRFLLALCTRQCRSRARILSTENGTKWFKALAFKVHRTHSIAFGHIAFFYKTTIAINAFLCTNSRTLMLFSVALLCFALFGFILFLCCENSHHSVVPV